MTKDDLLDTPLTASQQQIISVSDDLSIGLNVLPESETATRVNLTFKYAGQAPIVISVFRDTANADEPIHIGWYNDGWTGAW